ncbi:membrane protein insertion efficiency factor YidD [Superficieibacter sp. 1612_C1]|uniref:membrane protein insertion efficiency factor YidD n=1 Tax=Superficieibacter sp. 1612_C1 TaxID=2780382 RepID=UPI0018833B0E|nr:membrane protein insertion efficiency factor YidD [Superficieibacter sp. 1612_C1]
MDEFILKLIAFYQRVISPRKGYRCAYGVLHNTHGCSGAVKHIIQQKGIIAGWSDIRQRFADCHEAAQTLRARRLSDDEDESERKNKRRERAEWCCDIGTTPGDCVPSECPDVSCPEIPFPDVSCPCDCSWSGVLLRRKKR